MATQLIDYTVYKYIFTQFLMRSLKEYYKIHRTAESG